MFIAIAIAIIQQTTFISYLLESNYLTKTANGEAHSLMIGVAMFSALLSIPAFFWNVIMSKEANRKKDIVGIIIAIGTFVFGIGFLIFDFVSRIHAMGARIF